MDEPGDYLLAESDERERRKAKKVWLKPGRIATPFPGVRVTVLRTNGTDAEIALSLDRMELMAED